VYSSFSLNKKVQVDMTEGRQNKNWDVKEKGWETVQIKAFTSWLNGYLAKRDMQITDISRDMADGIKLINFLELLSDQKLKQKYTEHPPSRIEKIQNLHIALTFLEKDIGIKTAGASAEDFADGSFENDPRVLLDFVQEVQDSNDQAR